MEDLDFYDLVEAVVCGALEADEAAAILCMPKKEEQNEVVQPVRSDGLEVPGLRPPVSCSGVSGMDALGVQLPEVSVLEQRPESSETGPQPQDPQ